MENQGKKSQIISPEEARRILWERSNLTFKLDSNQMEMIQKFRAADPSSIVVWACSRRLGKSFLLCVLAIEECLKNKNVIIKMLAPKQKDIKGIIRPLIREIVADAPKELRPVENKTDSSWTFPSTGSQIQLAGCDGGRAESVRGSKSHLCIIDEAGFADDLDYIINSILLPTTATTDGKILLASTPPKSSDHDFRFFYRQAVSKGLSIHKTIYDNPRLSLSTIERLAEASGGKDSVSFRREYMAEFITDQDRAIVPEFTKELQSEIIQERTPPPYFKPYVAMDLGVKDLTVALFAYYDFREDKVVIEDELVLQGKKVNTTAIVEGIHEKEAKYFVTSAGESVRPQRFSDNNNLLLLNDLYQLHGLLVQPTKKDDKLAALNNMRIMLKDKRIIINPRCVTLIRHLESGLWNKNKTDFERTGDDGHADAIAACMYLIRNINFHDNPFPEGYGRNPQATYFSLNGGQRHKQEDAFLKIMNIRRK